MFVKSIYLEKKTELLDLVYAMETASKKDENKHILRSKIKKLCTLTTNSNNKLINNS